ncbi:MAG: magnesium/cobalt transporter CorA [Anaerolineales bacterium]|nr:magnesium/cobalt transporter CorA [Anaerolineales bacterium]MCX7754415.1 magnesium/cobalt transporter CorA [Anaerolineales bacterium]MDW8276529.1 magnesium/cobalt transporter CorA [Anaerolineales bacterium]
MLRALYYLPDGELRSEIPIKEFASLLKQPNGLLWVDFEAEPDASVEPILTGIFRFHPLAVDDALEETHTPKIDDWGEYVYIVLNAMNFDASDGLSLSTTELDIFLGPNYIVTHHDQPIPALEKAREAFGRDKRYTAHGPDHLLYKIIDHLVADYLPIVEAIDEQIDRVEDEVLVKAAPDTLERIFSLKRILLAMRRIITPQREVLNKLARDDYGVIDPHDRVFFRDIYDHLVRLHDLNESMRDLVSGALDTYLSVINNRMNEVMKTLTIITTLFMPITFITGFFGMNFFEPVAGLTTWTSLLVFVPVMVLLMVLPVMMFLWMKRRTWV